MNLLKMTIKRKVIDLSVVESGNIISWNFILKYRNSVYNLTFYDHQKQNTDW